MEEIKSTDIDTSRFTPEALASMRAQFPGEGAEQLARFLIARNGDVDKASDMLRAHVAWRELNLPVSRESCLAELSKGKMYRHGVDLDGRPVLFWRGALHLPHDRNISEMQNLILFMMQDVIANMPEHKSKMTIVFDRTDMAAANGGDLEFMKVAASILQNNFPERLHRAVIYPSGLVFYGIWNVAKWFLDPVTQQKVAPERYVSGVQQYIDEQYIPARMGGKSTYEFKLDDFPDQPGVVAAVAARELKRMELEAAAEKRQEEATGEEETE